MLDWLGSVFDDSGYMPRRSCGTWTTGEILLHNISDLVIGVSYIGIPLLLLYYVRKRPNICFSFLFYLFGSFIVFCGITHLIDIILFYWPIYRAAGIAKMLTAIVSFATFLSLFKVMPLALVLKTPREFQELLESHKLDLISVRSQLSVSQAELQDVKNKYKLFIENVQDHAIFILSPDRMIQTWNDAAEKMTGYTAEEVVGKHYSNISKNEQTDKQIEEIANTNGSCQYEGWRETSSGERYWASITLTTLRDDTGNLIGIVKLIKNLTEKKNLEIQLREKITELAYMNKRKDEFLAMLGHELRNPLAAMSNAIHLLQMPERTAEVESMAMTILDNQTEHIIRLVDDIIHATRAVMGKIELKLELVTASDIIERGVQIAEPLIDSMRHTLHVDMPCNGSQIMGDKIRLVQVVGNLLTNAAKYTPHGGNIHLSCKREGSILVIKVKDDGIGLEKKDFIDIFDLCVRTERAVVKENGLGVGLTMVKAIVEQHGGKVFAFSEGNDKGSEFTVHIPVFGEYDE